MLITILRDAFNIVERIKQIDNGYYICFNLRKNRYEVHNSKQVNTFCLVVPYKNLDARTLTLVRKTRRENFKKLMAEIDENNKKIENEVLRTIKDKSEWKLKEMFSFANHREGDVNFNDAYITKWA